MYINEVAALTPVELNRLVDRIGHTPIRPVDVMVKEKVRRIYLKLEGENPTGSMKDRTGYALVRHFEDRDILKMGSEIIESTSGNLGVALAWLCKARGYAFIAVVDPKTTQENIRKMQLFGAQIEVVQQCDESGGYLLSRLARVQELCRSHHYVWTNQYENEANPLIHYAHTGPEIYSQMEKKVDAVFVPVSTGGTLAGIGRFFREVSPSTRIIGVDAYGSVVFGTTPGPRKLTGIGSSRKSSFITEHLYDTYMLISDDEAFAACRSLHKHTHIKVGGSSGAVLSAGVRYLADYPHLNRVVCVCADSGEDYTSSIFNDNWIQQQKLDLSRRAPEFIQTIVQTS